ncbi:MAG: prepilin peptidase, partial [Acidimicrobiales bacterium]
MNLFGGVGAGIIGLAVGSFVNVVVHRLPRGESLVAPRSACPACGARLRAADNIPLISWLVLGAKCRSCKCRISFRYPAIEALTA